MSPSVRLHRSGTALAAIVASIALLAVSSADENADPLPVKDDGSNIILEEGSGFLDLRIGKSKKEDVEKLLGPPTQVVRANANSQRYTHRGEVTFHITD